jgi:membrane fusion protein, multidrug efflux system
MSVYTQAREFYILQRRILHLTARSNAKRSNDLDWIRRHPASFLIGLGIAGILAFTVYKYLTEPPGPAAGARGAGRGALITTSPVSVTEIRDEIEAIGTVFANESIRVTAQVTDTVHSVNFEDGQFVKEGVVLVEVTDDEETAQLEEARANHQEAQRQYNRFKDLASQRSASEQQLDEARSKEIAARARLEGVEARLKDRLIRAPFSGVLGFRMISPGELVTPGTEITTLDDIETVKVDFTVPERFVSSLREGMQVISRSTAWGDRDFVGTVGAIGNRIDANTRAVSVRARIPNADHALRPGMMLTIRLVISESAVIQLQDKSFVFTVVDGKANRIQIETGRRRPGYVEILSGLEAGQDVITLGVDRLRPGIPVNIKGAREGAGPKAGAPETGRGPGGRPAGKPTRENPSP